MSDDHVDGQSLSSTSIGCVQRCRRIAAEEKSVCFEPTVLIKHKRSDSATVPGRVELDVSGLGVQRCHKARSGHCRPKDSG
jgi:hypothetical protein